MTVDPESLKKDEVIELPPYVSKNPKNSKRSCMWKTLGGITIVVIIVAVVLLVTLTGNEDDEKTVEVINTGGDVLKYVPLIDGHNDLPYNLYTLEKNQLANFDFDSDLTKHPVWGSHASSFTDLPRLRTGRVGAQFWVAYVGCVDTQYKDAVERTLEQIDIIKRLVDKYPNDMMFVTTADGIWESFKEKKIGSMIGVEGGHSIDSRLSVLRLFYDLGVRYMTLAHSCNTPWVDASPIDDDPLAIKQNLTEWGKDVILEMNRLGMLIDLSHVSAGVMHSVLDKTKAPVIFSHSSAFTIQNHHRNVQDDVLRKLVTNKGIIMVNFYTAFLGGNTVDKVIEHLNHIKSITGPDHIGIGGDYDGIDSTPIELNDVSKYPVLFDKLAESGHGYEPWTNDELKKLAGLNLIRVMKDAEAISAEMKMTAPYDNIIPDEDLYAANNENSCRSDFNYAAPTTTPPEETTTPLEETTTPLLFNDFEE